MNFKLNSGDLSRPVWPTVGAAGADCFDWYGLRPGSESESRLEIRRVSDLPRDSAVTGAGRIIVTVTSI